MTNLEQNSEIAKCRKRVAILNARFDKLTELNQTHHYTFMVLGPDGKLIPNPKQSKYISLLTSIRSEKHSLWVKIRKLEPKVIANIDNGIRALSAMTREALFNLTSPVL